jgi:SAM-dependent methyltransferase
MLKARGQAEQYARALPASEGRPPLLIVVDVGHSIELYSEFTCTGGAYVSYPDPRSYRILLDRLDDPEVRKNLALAWTDPKALDPSRRSARVTREIAQSLGRLAQSLESAKHTPEAVATFLMRALFTMFAEDVELLPKDSFINLLKSLNGDHEKFVPMVGELWERMKTGGFSTALRENVRHFNGGLFEKATAIPLNDDQLALLIEAASSDWRDVEPAIFGTLLERALNPIERHRLGAHYTPRAYVERLVVPTIVEPLRAEWDAVKAAAVTLDRQGKQKEAAAEVQRFHRRLCEIRVLDPACGSGNFLYVTLEHLKRLEGEVLNALDQLDHKQAGLEMEGFSVDPHQLLGIEVNPRAAAIAELVLWIGYLQWHFRTRGSENLPAPIIKNFHNIECRDAVLASDCTEPVLDDHGKAVTRWDGRTTKVNPVTREDVPDEAARVPVLNYVNPRPAEWPQADFIVGNPPFFSLPGAKLDRTSSFSPGATGTVRDRPTSKCPLSLGSKNDLEPSERSKIKLIEDPEKRARFERYLGMNEVPQDQLKAYANDMNAVIDLLHQKRTTEAWQKLYQLAKYQSIDAGVSWELANRIESIWNADQTKGQIAQQNDRLQKQSDTDNRNADMDSDDIKDKEVEYARRLKNAGVSSNKSNGGGTPSTNGAPETPGETASTAVGMSPPSDQILGKLQLTEEYLNSLEAQAKIKLNEMKVEKLLDQAKSDFADYITTLYKSGRYQHVLIATDCPGDEGRLQTPGATQSSSRKSEDLQSHPGQVIALEMTWIWKTQPPMRSMSRI